MVLTVSAKEQVATSFAAAFDIRLSLPLDPGEIRAHEWAASDLLRVSELAGYRGFPPGTFMSALSASGGSEREPTATKTQPPVETPSSPAQGVSDGQCQSREVWSTQQPQDSALFMVQVHHAQGRVVVIGGLVDRHVWIVDQDSWTTADELRLPTLEVAVVESGILWMTRPEAMDSDSRSFVNGRAWDGSQTSWRLATRPVLGNLKNSVRLTDSSIALPNLLAGALCVLDLRLPPRAIPMSRLIPEPGSLGLAGPVVVLGTTHMLRSDATVAWSASMDGASESAAWDLPADGVIALLSNPDGQQLAYAEAELALDPDGYRFNAESTEEETAKIDADIELQVDIRMRRIYAKGLLSQLEVRDRETGEVLWTREAKLTEDRPSDGPTVNGRCLLWSEAGDVSRLEARTGIPLWTRDDILGVPASGDGRFLAYDADRTLPLRAQIVSAASGRSTEIPAGLERAGPMDIKTAGRYLLAKPSPTGGLHLYAIEGLGD
jgi:hypothetical protein